MQFKNEKIRYNEEYFGYLVGFPDGQIIITKKSAKALLESNSNFESINQHKLEQIEIKKGFFLNTPPLIWLEITKKCNLTCPHCYIDGGIERENELTTEEILEIIDDIADMGVWAIAITGGEPTLHPDFSKIVQYARKRNLLVGVATHGLHLTDKLLSELPTDGLIISVSIDDLHLKNKGSDIEFKIATDAILRCIKYGFHTNIMTNTNKKNVDKLDNLVKWAEKNEVSVRSVPFSPIGDRAKKYASVLENTPEDAYKVAKFWFKEMKWEHEYHQKVGLCVGVIFNYGLTLAYMSQRCSSGRFLSYICSDGTVYPCTMCAGEKIFSPGNLKDIKFSQLWKQQWEIREKSWDDFKETCSSCPLNSAEYYCSARCPAMSHARHNNFSSCGASPFEKVSLVVRTSMLESYESLSLANENNEKK